MANGERKAAWQGSKWIRKTTRHAIYLRDGFACVYCGSGIEDEIILTLDHVVSAEVGGTNAPRNLVTACLSCNSEKAHFSLRDWFARLRDRGVDTRKIGARIRRLRSKPLDREGARKFLAARRAEANGESEVPF